VSAATFEALLAAIPADPYYVDGFPGQRRDVAGILATVGAALDRAHIEGWVRDLELEGEWEPAKASET
jgi:hypothetical protein